MRVVLIPVCHGADIILPFKQSLMSNAYLLKGYFQILLEEYGIFGMPTVK